jgi:hypothetical protein
MDRTAQSEQSWARYMTSGKQEMHRNNLVAATRMFHRAETEARQFGATDLRRLLALSWAAVGYYKMANFQLSESIFKQVFESYERCLPCRYTEEIAHNLLYFAYMYQQQGRKTEARIYYAALGPAAESRAQQLSIQGEARRSIVRGANITPAQTEDRLTEVKALRQVLSAAAENAERKNKKGSGVAQEPPQAKERNEETKPNNDSSSSRRINAGTAFSNPRWRLGW